MRKSQNRSKTDKDKALAPVPFLSCPRLFGGGRCRPSRFILPKNQSFSTLSAAHKPSKAPATTSEGQWSPVFYPRPTDQEGERIPEPLALRVFFGQDA